MRTIKEQGKDFTCATANDLCKLQKSEERDLISHLAALTTEVENCAAYYDSAKLTRYVYDLATLFHKFYNSCRCMCDDESLMRARLTLCKATATVIKVVLSMLKIDAPEKM